MQPNLKREMETVMGRVRPALGEYFDAHMVLGIRAGSDVAMYAVMANAAQQHAIEDTILALAAEIVARRNAPTHGPQ